MIHLLMLVAAGTACHAVNSDRILGSDLAAVSSAFSGLAPETVIGYAPQPGNHRTMEPAELIRIAAANGFEIHDVTSVCFERNVVPLDAAGVLSALKASLNRPDAEIEVLEFSKYSLPPGKLVFPLDALPAHAIAHTAIWNGYVDFEGRHFPVWARARVTVPQIRVVTTAPLRAGQTITAADVRLEDVRDFPAKSEPLASLAQCVERAAKRFMSAGSTLNPEDIAEPNDVNRGDTVTVEVRSGEAVLMLPAQADMAGHRGQVISLRNSAGGKMFRARITGKDTALLDCLSPETYK